MLSRGGIYVIVICLVLVMFTILSSVLCVLMFEDMFVVVNVCFL